MSNQIFKNKQDASQLIDNGLQYLLGDLKILSDNRQLFPMSFPLILLAFSGMEYLSALLFSDTLSHYSDRVERYMQNWMPENYNRLEGSTTLGRFLYDSLRSGLTHFGNVKGDIVVDHDDSALSCHLQWVEHGSKRRLFVHGYEFASDFVASVERVKEGITKGDISLDKIRANSATLESLLERSTRREPARAEQTDQALLDWLNGENRGTLPDSTTGTSYSGGV